MRNILLSASSTLALFAAACGAAAPASAQTTISSSTSANTSTSTAANGSPSDVVIASGVTVSPSSGAAVTIDSNNSVTNNGTISFSGVDGATGIAASGGLTGTITNTGTITVTETSTAVDENGDTFIDGPFATGVNRYGIHVTGPGIFTGSISNTGPITVVGNTSAAIAVDGTLAGSLNNTAAVSIAGANSYGIHTGAVTGDVTSSGAITAQGQNVVGVALDGDVGGTVTITDAVSATGFRGGATAYATPVADDLYIGGPALRIAGNVAGGVTIGTGGSLISYGSAPALLVGSANEAITLSPVSGSTYGLVLTGAVTGNGVNANIDANAITIGGQGMGATIAGGISLTGTVSSTANQANATGLLLASGAATPTVAVTGTLSSTGGVGSYASTALLVASGANLPSLTNTGTISATSSGNAGTSTAVRDLSGTLTSLTNSGTIKASLTGSYAAGQATAIDLSANTSGVAITQAPASSTTTIIPLITGAILTGSGNDTLVVSAGSINGAVSLGAGNNSVALSGTGQLTGAVDLNGGAGTLALAGKSALTSDVTFGAGSTMTVGDTASFTGAIVQNGNPLALTVTGGTFGATNTGTIALSSLSVGAGGTFRVNVDPTAGTATLYAVSGSAAIASGASVGLNISHFLASPQSYTILTAGTLTGGTGLSVLSTGLPYIYAAALTTDATAGTIALTLQPKTAAALGLNRSGAAAYGAVFNAIQTDSVAQGAFVSANDNAGFQRLYSEMLPEHAGAAFLSTSMVSQAISDFEAQPDAPRASTGRLGLWITQVGSLLNKAQGDTQAYHLFDYGLGLGAEYGLHKFGTVGIGYDWSYNDVRDPANANDVIGDMSELSGYWRGQWAGLRLHAHGSWGHVSFSSTRELTDPASGNVLETASAAWGATATAFAGGGGYEARLGRILLRPAGNVDYFGLDDSAHAETGAGTGFDLSVGERRSHALTGTYTLTAGYRLSRSDDSDSRVELEVGDRQRLGGGIADTVAAFSGGQSFALQADALRYGPLAKLRVAIDTDVVSLVAEAKAQKVQGTVAAGATAGIRFRL